MVYFVWDDWIVVFGSFFLFVFGDEFVVVCVNFVEECAFVFV